MPYSTSRSYTRWWWFAGEIRDEDIRAQLDWVNQNGFGGVEIAWLYPQDGAAPGPGWLSPEWSASVAFAKRYCDQLGLGCDFTFGTSWPFGGSVVQEQDASRDFSGLSPQRLEKSWEWPIEGYLLNHLDRAALERYANTMGNGLSSALKGAQSALFCDSWEVDTGRLWTDGFGETFRELYGYDIEAYTPDIDSHPDERYDYRSLISRYVLDEFYRPLTTAVHNLGAIARVQCHGAPTDLLAAYACADIPESEAILFDPEFSNIAASSAALAGHEIVSAESFTCLYGWAPKPGPGPYQGQEQIADIKLLADSLFANGVNQIFWHGMPYNVPGGQNRFYATVHVGPDSSFAGELPALNEYMTTVSRAMKRGHTCSDVAVYAPIEDGRMLGELPPDLRKPSARYHWEMHYARLPRSLKGYRPLWITLPFLKAAEYYDGQLHSGEAVFSALYVNVEWLDHEALAELTRLAKQGLPICMAQRPREPGGNKTDGYAQDLTALMTRSNVSTDFGAVMTQPRMVNGHLLTDLWCRREGEAHFFFFANPKARRLRYPLAYGQSFMEEAAEREVEFNLNGRRIHHVLRFEPYRSLLLAISPDGTVDRLDPAYIPPAPSQHT